LKNIPPIKMKKLIFLILIFNIFYCKDYSKLSHVVPYPSLLKEDVNGYYGILAPNFDLFFQNSQGVKIDILRSSLLMNLIERYKKRIHFQNENNIFKNQNVVPFLNTTKTYGSILITITDFFSRSLLLGVDESYSLSINKDGIYLNSFTVWGTLRYLLFFIYIQIKGDWKPLYNF
jgi:hypothetical protein